MADNLHLLIDHEGFNRENSGFILMKGSDEHNIYHLADLFIKEYSIGQPSTVYALKGVFFENPSLHVDLKPLVDYYENNRAALYQNMVNSGVTAVTSEMTVTECFAEWLMQRYGFTKENLGVFSFIERGKYASSRFNW